MEIEDHKTRLVVASNLTAAFYASVTPERSMPESVEERDKIQKEIIARFWLLLYDLSPSKKQES